MQLTNNKCKTKPNIIEILFMAFCFFPFIFPNPIVTTNIQPYAALLGTLIIIDVAVKTNFKVKVSNNFFLIAFLTLAVSIAVLFFNNITISSFRALFNYYSVAIIPLAVYLILNRIEVYPEEMTKILILIWFVVASIQFFVNRGFLTGIIGGVRFSYSYRGVVGLASEPSFLGIACFYFLHMTMKFKSKQLLYVALILIMGIVYAQSMMGVLFIASFLAIYVLDSTNTKKGFYIWLGAIIAVIGFILLLNTVLAGTRLHQLFSFFIKDGMEGILVDKSVGTRYESLTNAIAASFANNLLPLGYTRRLGSGYGGFLCELGFFALPILWCISRAMSLTFKKRLSQILYFIIVTILLFNNTQVGNPLLLFVIGTNLAFAPKTMLTESPSSYDRRNKIAG